MKLAWKRILSLLLIAAMVLSFGATGYAVDDDDDIAIIDPEAAAAAEQQMDPVTDGTQLELEDLDPATLGVHKLGEDAEETEEISVLESGEDVSAKELDPDALVRVSIFLDEAATLDAGYSLRGVGTNSSAIAYRDSLKASQAALTAQIAAETGHEPDVQWNMTLAVNAISAYVRAGDIPVISKIAGVRSIVRENYYEPPKDEVAEPNTANTSENMVGAVEAWDAGYTGAGSRIAIIDTGIDTTHQSFAAEPFTYSVGLAGATNELMTQKQVQDLASQLNSKSSNYVSAKIPYGYNYVDKNTTINHTGDTQGEHGSHVAGIAAANRYIGSAHNDAASTVGAVGMAPDAQLFIMKVFGSSGGAYDSDYMVAIEDAIVLDCDVVNLSLGSSVQGWTFDDTYQDILNNLTNREHNEGMVVSISAGNAYDFAFMTSARDLYRDDVYYHTGGSPGSFVNSLCVAAAQNTIIKGTPMQFNGSQDVYYYESTENSDGEAYTNPALSTIVGTYDYVYIDSAGTAADYSAINSAVSLSGKVVIVNRGEISFVEKGENAKSYSPKAVIIANNTDGTIYMDLSDFTGTFPMVTITQKDANRIKEGGTAHTTNGITYYTGSMKVTNTEKSVVIDRAEATITDFSSWGVPGSLLMKPEITAPGGNIYSVAGTHQTTSGGTAGGSDQYEDMSGTSMAAPHITGLSAVVAEYLRENPIADRNSELSTAYSTRAIIQSLLMSTATPMRPEGNYLPVLQQGAGLADVSKAVSAPSVLMMNEAALTSKTGANADGKVKVELGDDPDQEGVYSYSFTLYNLSDQTLSYTLHTDLFTQKTDGTYSYRKTMDLPAGGVSYVWNGESAAEPETNEHDVNEDGKTDEADAQAILDYLAFLVEEDDLDLKVADLDEDEEITSYDAYLLLNYEPEGGSAAGDYVLAPHSSATVDVTIKLTAEQRSFLESNFPRGAYLEGFTYVTGSGSTKEGQSLDHMHSIPILGFYGSWTGPSMFDNMSYIDGLYGADRLPYSGNSDTNYLMVNYNGSNLKFSGNPYMVENEFPADRLALNANTNLIRISYNLVRAAGTTGYAVSKLDAEGKVTDVVTSTLTGNNVYGMFYSQSGGWQNTSTKLYSINKTVSSYGLNAGDRFRLGFYAIPEYNAMIVKDSYNAADSGVLNLAGFNELLLSNDLGKGAFVGYDFVVDNTEPTIEQAQLSGNTITVTASDNENLAYVAVLSLDGTVKYAEAAPGSNTYSITFDASDAIANARGYVAVFAGDYAGNEAARAIKVNDNAYEEKTVYVLADSLTESNDYLIVSRNTAGAGYALGHSGATVATNAVTVKAGISDTDNKPYIDSDDVANTSVWTASSGIKLKNGNYYLRRISNTSTTLQVSTTNSYNSWTYSNNRLYQTYNNRSYYVRYYNSNFTSMTTTATNIYVYQKTVIRTAIDPYTATGVTITPTSLDLYKGNTADLVAKVTPITAADRTVTWSSSDSSIATVDGNGHVEAKAAGTATITATSNGNGAVSAACTVTVTSINKSLNAIVWDEEGGVYFSSFNANNLPTWTKLHNDNKNLQLCSAYMADASTLYAATLDTSSQESTIYTVNRSTYALTEFGNNYVMAFGMARASTSYTDYFVYGFAKYLIFGNLTPTDDGEGGTFSGLPYGLLDLSTTSVGDAYVCGVCARSVGTTSSSFYFLDETGKLWTTTMSIGSSVSFGTPSLVVDTGIGTSFLYQSIYYDGKYIYWSHQTDNEAELIIINPGTGKVYHAGNFGDNIWPVVGIYVNGSAAPASADEDVPMSLELQPVATREDLLTEEVMQRMGLALTGSEQTEKDYEIVDMIDSEPTLETEEPEIIDIEPIGTLNAFRGTTVLQGAGEMNQNDEGLVTIAIKEESPSTNGFITLTYDPELLTLNKEETQSRLDYYAMFLDEEKGVVTFVYANKDELPEDTVLAEIFLTAACEDADILVDRLEHNQDLGLADSLAEYAVTGIGHDWGEPTYEWAADNSSVTATSVCSRDDTHTLTETANTTYEVITEPTTESEGLGRYTAVFSNELFGTQTKDVTIEKLPVVGYHISLENYTNAGAAASIDAEALYQGEVSFTVEADKAVLVAVKNGDAYTVLPCTTDAEGEHSFTVTVEKDTTIVLAFKGDANLDGAVKAMDGTMVKRASLGSFTLPGKLNELVCDLDGNGEISSLEGTMVSRAVLGTYTIAW